MDVTLEVSTTDYLGDLLLIKKSLSHMESLLGCYNGYVLSEPATNFGWTFFKIAFKANFQAAIEEKFGDMIGKYRWSNQSEKFGKFMTDFFNARGCNVKIKILT